MISNTRRGFLVGAATTAALKHCATADGAYLTFDEDKKGSLQAGRFADLVVLSADPLTVADPEIANISARMTTVGGKIVHRRRTGRGKEAARAVSSLPPAIP